MTSANCVQMVTDLTQKGFQKVTIINKSYQVMGASAQDHVPAAWKNTKGVTINENQELKNDWSKQKETGVFHFYKQKWAFVGQENDALNMNLNRKLEKGSKENNMLLVREREDHWILCAGKVKGQMQKKVKEGEFKSFAAAIDALEDVLNKHGWGDD